MGWLILLAFLLALLGVLLVVVFSRGRRTRGLGAGETVALDDVTLYSETHGLVGRPDRIVREGGWFIPEEWKASKRVSDGHRLQLGTYFILGDGSRVRVENTEELCSEVVEKAERIREHRARMAEELPVRQPAWKCQKCGQRASCSRRST